MTIGIDLVTCWTAIASVIWVIAYAHLTLLTSVIAPTAHDGIGEQFPSHGASAVPKLLGWTGVPLLPVPIPSGHDSDIERDRD